MEIDNYCNDLWPLIYDQYNQGRHQQELAFYSHELGTCSGPVLEVACGTGMIFLALLKQGIDVYGFDLSRQMLEVLFAKAKDMELSALHRRVSQQNMINFQINEKFESVFIPARSFLHLPTQDDQLACLRNIHHHLYDDGKLIINFFTPSLPTLLKYTESNPEYIVFGKYPHPDGVNEVKVSMCQTNDLGEQIMYITYRFEVSGKVHEGSMLVRWIYKNEFELLAKLAGFSVRHLYSGFNKLPYSGDGEMVWVLEKTPNKSL